LRKNTLLILLIVITLILVFNTDYVKDLVNPPENKEDTSPELQEPENTIKDESGEYVGRIDNNFIEIKVEGEPKTFLAPMDIVGSEYYEGDAVVFDYYVNEQKQLVITRIENQAPDFSQR
jgi:hypothetical protein